MFDPTAPENNPSMEETQCLVALFAAGDYIELENQARQQTHLYPNAGFAWKALGTALFLQSKEALFELQMATKLMPYDADAHNNFGNALAKTNQYDSAISCYRNAIKINPESVEAHFNLGHLQQTLGRLDAALASYSQALALRPDYAEAHNNRGSVQHRLGQFSDAMVSYEKAIELKPDFAEAYNNLGSLQRETGRLLEAVVAFRNALSLRPHFAEAHNNLGNVLQNLAQFEEALAHFNRAVELKPDYAAAHSNLLFCLNYHPSLSAEAIFAEYGRWNHLHAQSHNQLRVNQHDNEKTVARRLRIGYVSPDFQQHSARHFIEPLLMHHDKREVQIFAYAEVMREDEVSERFKGMVDQWCNTVGMSDDAMANRIRHDGIDILVDLAGHTQHNRLRVLARKPAPIQVSWMGYGYTTGMDAVDYFFADPTFAPFEYASLFAEKLVHLPIMAVYRPTDNMGEPGPLPATTSQAVSFGTLSRSVRINSRVIQVWAEILKRLPQSRLIINSHSFVTPTMQRRIVDQFAAFAVGGEQLEIGFESPASKVLQRVDIGLDCFPHNSGTTLYESLYMGVPYITLKGRPSVGRLGAALLNAVGHTEWIADSEQDYIEKAISLASDLAALAGIRQGLRSELAQSPLMDEAGFASAVETAYRTMWRRWCDGESPTHFKV